MYYKIVKGNLIVDATQYLSFVRQNLRNKVIIACEPEFANGIVSSDGSAIWHLEGQPNFIEGEFETVKAIEISEDEYNRIVEVLTDKDEVVEDAEEIRAPLSNAEVLEQLDALKRQVNNLTEQNNQLLREIESLRVNG